MKPRTLATTTLLSITWLASLGAFKPPPTTHSFGNPFSKDVETAAHSDDSDSQKQTAVMFLMAGILFFGFIIISSDKIIFLYQRFAHKNQLAGVGKDEVTAKTEEYTKDLLNELIDPTAQIKLAYSHFQQGAIQKAIEDFNEAIRVNPHSAYLYSERANFRRKNLGDKQGAIEDYSVAIGIHPHNAFFYLWRSQVYHDLGDEKRAINDYNTAIRLAPDNTMYHSFQETSCKSP